MSMESLAGQGKDAELRVDKMEVKVKLHSSNSIKNLHKEVK